MEAPEKVGTMGTMGTRAIGSGTMTNTDSMIGMATLRMTMAAMTTHRDAFQIHLKEIHGVT